MQGVGQQTNLGLHLGIVHNGYNGAVSLELPEWQDASRLQSRKDKRTDETGHTILNLAHACLEIIQGQVADLIFEVIQVHDEG